MRRNRRDPDNQGVTTTTENEATYQHPRVPCWAGKHDRWDTQAPCATCGAPRTQRPNWEPHQHTLRATSPVDQPVDPKVLAVPAWIAVGGGVAMIVGSFLPWITATAPFIGSFTKSGVDGGGDGMFSVALGAIVAALGLTLLKGTGRFFPKAMGVISAGGLGLLLAIYESNNVRDRIADVTAKSDLIVASVGSGLYLIGAAAVAVIVAGVMAAHRVNH